MSRDCQLFLKALNRIFFSFFRPPTFLLPVRFITLKEMIKMLCGRMKNRGRDEENLASYLFGGQKKKFLVTGFSQLSRY